MNNESSQNKLLYVEEHRLCRNHLEKVEHGFKYIELDQGEVLSDKEGTWNYLLFALGGECAIQCNRYKERPFPEGTMVLFPKKSRIELKARAAARLLVLSFDVPLNNCDKFALQALAGVCAHMKYDFRPTEIRYPLPPYLELVTFCLSSKMDCGHFHPLLEQELFFLLRGFYAKEELAYLFHPIISTEICFKDFVVENYRKVDSVNELISLANMGRTTFFEKFKEAFGMPAKQWLLQQRDTHIISKILVSESTIGELSEEFNFRSQAHFSQYCRKHFKCTPTELITRFRA